MYFYQCKFSNFGVRKKYIPQKAICIGRKPSAAHSGTAISGPEPGLNSNEPEKLRPFNQTGIVIGASGTRQRVECSESIFGFAASENGEGSGAPDGGDGEDCSGDADEEGDE